MSATSRSLTRQTWGVVKQNPYLLLFPVTAAALGTVVVLIVIGAGMGILGFSTASADLAAAADGGNLPTSTKVIGIVVFVLAAYLGTLITQVCMGGLVHCADQELQGRDSSFGEGMGAALGKLPHLIGWAAIQTAVGWLLSLIQGNGGDNIVVNILRLVLATLASVAWSVITFFVLPMIMLRDKGPIEAIKASVSLIRSTWGMQIRGGVRIGIVIALLGILPGFVALLGGFYFLFAEKYAVGVPLITLGVVVILIAQILISALRAVFSVALLHYAEDGSAIGPFGTDELAAAVTTKTKK
ncbi:MAG: DUF6159 family protein [Candidatus Nanopelagicales bacterium]